MFLLSYIFFNALDFFLIISGELIMRNKLMGTS